MQRVTSPKDVSPENALPVVLEICNQRVGSSLTLAEAAILHQAFVECEELLKKNGERKESSSAEPVTKPGDLTQANYFPVLRNLLDAKVKQGFVLLEAALLNRCLELLQQDLAPSKK